MYGKGSNCLLHVTIQFSQYHLLKRDCTFPQWMVLAPWLKVMMISFWTVSFILLLYVSLCQYHTVLTYVVLLLIFDRYFLCLYHFLKYVFVVCFGTVKMLWYYFLVCIFADEKSSIFFIAILFFVYNASIIH